jgi:hypothetical protein
VILPTHRDIAERVWILADGRRVRAYSLNGQVEWRLYDDNPGKPLGRFIDRDLARQLIVNHEARRSQWDTTCV